ncbi:MAG: thioredoxin domain-containing protein [Nanoarchaeota archaeon]
MRLINSMKSIIKPAGLRLMLILLLICTVFLSSCSNNPEVLNEFASCLAEKGAKMYGASWCGHCQSQKEMFGEAFAKVNYIECTLDEQACISAGIQGYPTWKFADGSSAAGAQSFTALAEKTGCSSP